MGADIGACADQRKSGSLAPFFTLIWSLRPPMTAIRESILNLQKNGIAAVSQHGLGRRE